MRINGHEGIERGPADQVARHMLWLWAVLFVLTFSALFLIGMSEAMNRLLVNVDPRPERSPTMQAAVDSILHIGQLPVGWFAGDMRKSLLGFAAGTALNTLVWACSFAFVIVVIDRRRRRRRDDHKQNLEAMLAHRADS